MTTTATTARERMLLAQSAARSIGLLSDADKRAALLAIADAIEVSTGDVVAANAEDLERGRQKGLSAGLLDRLTLDDRRIAAIAQAVRDIAALPDPVGEVVRGSTLANGLQIRQMRVPMGVVGMIYEARPNVTADAAGIRSHPYSTSATVNPLRYSSLKTLTEVHGAYLHCT